MLLRAPAPPLCPEHNAQTKQSSTQRWRSPSRKFPGSGCGWCGVVHTNESIACGITACGAHGCVGRMHVWGTWMCRAHACVGRMHVWGRCAGAHACVGRITGITSYRLAHSSSARSSRELRRQRRRWRRPLRQWHASVRRVTCSCGVDVRASTRVDDTPDPGFVGLEALVEAEGGIAGFWYTR
jgi:hypothetical protein